MKYYAISFVALLSFFILCFTHYDDYEQSRAEPRLLETSDDLKDFLEVGVLQYDFLQFWILISYFLCLAY